MWTLRSMCALTASLVICICGCGGDTSRPASEATQLAQVSDADLAASLASGGGEDAEAASANAAASRRKIIHTGNLQLTVVDFSPVPSQVVNLAQQHGGYVAKSEIQGRTGSPRSGRWTLRVPVERYSALMQSATGLGELTSLTEDSEEVTAEYLDLEARIRAKQEEETRLTKHLHEDAKNLDQILQIERELQRVRTEVEQMQGRLRLLSDLTTLSTVELAVNEVTPFVPEESPTFGTLASRTWNESFGTLVAAAQGFTLTLIGLLPWIAMLAIPAWLAWQPLRRQFSELARRSAGGAARP
jgi:hypothetical protein